MSNIKQSFCSRFGESGYIIEADFSQLEIYGLAIITKDLELVNDLREGLDQHAESATWLNPDLSYKDVTDGVLRGDPSIVGLRKKAKAARFALQYGASAPTIAKQAGITLRAAEEFIDRYYTKYALVKEWQDKMINDFARYSKVEYVGTIKAPVMYWMYQSPSGRLYRFATKPLEARVSPTILKNYPIQGFSTGDIMGYVITKMVEVSLDSAFQVIGTVHDSILFDVPIAVDAPRDSFIREKCRSIETMMESLAKRFVENELGMDMMGLDFKVKASYGHTWAEAI